jgi:intein-encoded DNA endonuclease-like protein
VGAIPTQASTPRCWNGRQYGLKTRWVFFTRVGSNPTLGTNYMRGLPINKKFFNSWNSNMSYVLGFIVADGCIGIKRIRKKDGIKNYYFNITTKDKLHLENIKKAMNAQQKIYSKSNGYTKRKNYYFIQIGHQEICKDLLRLGIQPRKTHNLEPIKVPDEYFADFVRGFFDGDGTVYIYSVNRTPQIKAGFVSTRLSFFAEFNKQLCKNLGIPTKSIHRIVDKRGKEKMIQFNTHFYIDDCEKLAKFMYGNNPRLYLSRKRQIFQKWKAINRRHYIKQNYPSKISWRLNEKILV